MLLCSAGPLFAADFGPIQATEPPPVPADGATSWTVNLYDDAGFRWQDPDWTACTASSALMMLNMIALASDEDSPLRGSALPRPKLSWQLNTTFERQEEMLAYERASGTLAPGADGADANGWRNALNQFGWGSIDAGVYRVSAYDDFDPAVRAVVISLARHRRPVGILGWSGRHAQFVTGYVVSGQDPRVSDDFAVDAVALSDPLWSSQIRNTWVSYRMWEYGPNVLRFTQYWQSDSFLRDPLTGLIGDREWRSRWVIVDAAK